VICGRSPARGAPRPPRPSSPSSSPARASGPACAR
jgi:hypothetical protein